MATNNPRVSIGMPIYNGEQFLEAAIESILVQTFTDFELIISDNASTDRTREICRAYALQDQRIRYYRNELNIGVSANFNRVFKLSTGEYFKWAAADDVCASTFLERCIEALDQKPSVVLCYPKTRIINEHGQLLRNSLLKLSTMSPVPHKRFNSFILANHGCFQLFGVIRRAILETTSLHGKYVGSDRNLLAELSLIGQFYEVPEHLFFQREHPRTSWNLWPDDRERLIYFDPTGKAGRLYLPTWKRGIEYLKSVWRAPLRWSERLLCYAQIGKWMVRRRQELVRDLIVAAKQFHS